MKEISSVGVTCKFFISDLHSFSTNKKEIPKGKSFLSMILPQFEDINLKVLLIAGFFTLLAGFTSEEDLKWVEGASIFFAVAFIVLFTAANDYAKEKQLQKLF